MPGNPQQRAGVTASFTLNPRLHVKGPTDFRTTLDTQEKLRSNFVLEHYSVQLTSFYARSPRIGNNFKINLRDLFAAPFDLSPNKVIPGAPKWYEPETLST